MRGRGQGLSLILVGQQKLRAHDGGGEWLRQPRDTFTRNLLYPQGPGSRPSGASGGAGPPLLYCVRGQCCFLSGHQAPMCPDSDFLFGELCVGVL